MIVSHILRFVVATAAATALFFIWLQCWVDLWAVGAVVTIVVVRWAQWWLMCARVAEMKWRQQKAYQQLNRDIWE